MQNTPNSGSRFLLRERASVQIREVARFLANSARRKAVAWFADVLWTCEQLAAQPNLGATFSLPEPQLHSLRRFRVRNPRAYWIYYRPFASGNGIEVFAVLHERQNIGEQLEAALEP